MISTEKELELKTRRGWDYFNSRDIESFVKGIGPDYVWYTDVFPEPLRGSEGTRRGLQNFFTAFPDIRFEVEQVFAHDNYTVVRFSGRGTRTNGFMGLPATNRPYTYQGAAINKFNERGQRIITWVFFDRYKILQQIAGFPATLESFMPNLVGQPQTSTVSSNAGLASPSLDVSAVAGEEVLVRYGHGEGNVLDDPQYITLHVDLFKANGERGGYYMGIQQATGPTTPQKLMTRPPMPQQPVDQPGNIPVVGVTGNYKATWWFNSRDSITAVGPSVAHLSPLRDGTLVFSTSATGIITGGTGRYEGASGVKSAAGSGHILEPSQLAPGGRFRANTLDIFRILRKESVAIRVPQSSTASTSTRSSSSSAGRTQPAQTASASPMPQMPQLPPTFPPGVNPETYQIEKVTQLLKSAAYFPIFNVPNPNSPNQPVYLIPGIRFLMTAVNVNEELHRFEIRVEEATAGKGLRASKRVGESVANVHIRWTPMPENFEAAPGRYPPTTVLNPFTSQRFCMLEGQLTFKDRDGSGFRAFGTGRTFPVNTRGSRQLRIGAVIDILEGLGRFKGLQGTMVINGYIQPPDSLALNLMARIMDPSGSLQSRSRLRPIQPITDPDPDAVFMVFLGEPDPSKPVQLNVAPDGTILGSNVHELLRLVELGFDLGPSGELRSRTVEGPVVGTVSATLYFNPMSPMPIQPIQTTDGVFTFFDRQRRVIGTVNANMVEGRAIRTELAGAPMPVFRFGGFGPLLGGTGEFAGADGMMTMNSAISVFPRTLSNLYILRFVDPSGRLRATFRNGRAESTRGKSDAR